MKAKSIKGKSSEEIKLHYSNAWLMDFKPTLAIVLLSKSQDRKAICEILDADRY